MGIEAAMGQADLFHDVGDARAVVPALPNGARGGPDDPFVGDFLAAWGGPAGGGRVHMMGIILQSGAERQRPTPGLIGGRTFLRHIRATLRQECRTNAEARSLLGWRDSPRA